MQSSAFDQFMTTVGIALLLCPFAGFAQKPSLVHELEVAIEAGGAQAVQQRFDEIWPQQRDQYTVDLQALTRMVGEKAQNSGGGDRLLEVLSRITSTVAETEMAAMMASPNIQRSMTSMQEDEQTHSSSNAEPAETEESAPDAAAGARNNDETRQDLQRFTGLYGAPDSPRKLFVTQTCNGYLMVGAMWGDVAPFQMVSTSENTFDNNNEHFKLEVEFETDSSGGATEMRHTLNALPSPAMRSGELPDDWQSCVER